MKKGKVLIAASLMTLVLGATLLTACTTVDSEKGSSENNKVQNESSSETTQAKYENSTEKPQVENEASTESTQTKNESSSETVSQDDANANDKITITGSATLTVRKLIPDYVLDDTTLQCAVVTEFQDSPYVIFVGEDIAKELQENETYVFEIEDTEVDKNLVMQNGSLSDKAAFTNYPISIKSVRKAGEDEIGLASKFLEVK